MQSAQRRATLQRVRKRGQEEGPARRVGGATTRNPEFLTKAAGGQGFIYAEHMIKYRKQNALEPEKDAEFSLNLTPLMFFSVGYLAMKALIGTVRRAS